MLIKHLQTLKSDLNSLIAENNSPVYNAAYNAYYDVSKANVPDTKQDDDDFKTIVDKTTQDRDKKMEDDAKIFANSFCKGLKDSGFMDAIADGIDSHIKEITLTITMMPQGIATIISPVGPCTGSMVISDSTAQIQIL